MSSIMNEYQGFRCDLIHLAVWEPYNWVQLWLALDMQDYSIKYN